MNLQEIKKGKTGYGLLIENDGYIKTPFTESNKLTEGIIEVPEDFDFTQPLPVVFQKFGIENANGRIYPEAILKREVEKYQKEIENRVASGEANHPDDVSLNIDRLTHLVTDLHWEGHTLVGHIKLLLSPGYIKNGIISCSADQCANLMRNGLRLGVSSRGAGSVEKIMDKTIVQDDFELYCFDIVTQPSTPGAWIGKQMEELTPFIESKQSKYASQLDKFLR